MKVLATDADDPDNENSQIAYSLLDQKPNHDMFYITQDGIIKVKKNTLDREVVYNGITLQRICHDYRVITLKPQPLTLLPKCCLHFSENRSVHSDSKRSGLKRQTTGKYRNWDSYH